MYNKIIHEYLHSIKSIVISRCKCYKLITSPRASWVLVRGGKPVNLGKNLSVCGSCGSISTSEHLIKCCLNMLFNHDVKSRSVNWCGFVKVR